MNGLEIRQSQVYDEEILQTPRNSILPPRTRKVTNPRTGEPMEIPVQAYAPRTVSCSPITHAVIFAGGHGVTFAS